MRRGAGPAETYKYLTDSNTDWAQQLVATADYVHEHNIHDCWIAYFAAPFILPADYGIPCKRLPTYDSTSVPEDILDVPQTISGPVFISAGSLTGFEFGSRVLNPYESFLRLKPVAQIQDGIFVYDGSFSVPLASALGPTQLSGNLLKAGDTAGALKAGGTGSGHRSGRDHAGGCAWRCIGGHRCETGGARGLRSRGFEGADHGAGRPGAVARDDQGEAEQVEVTSLD